MRLLLTLLTVVGLLGCGGDDSGMICDEIAMICNECAMNCAEQELDCEECRLYCNEFEIDCVECLLTYNPPNVQDQNVLQNNNDAIENYLDQNGLTASKTATGLYYIIDSEGEIVKPDLCDNVFISYSGYFLDGETFDNSPGVVFPLANLIPAWQEGIPLFGRGGRGTLITPSYLAYGSQGAGSVIPPNSVLLFDIILLDF